MTAQVTMEMADILDVIGFYFNPVTLTWKHANQIKECSGRPMFLILAVVCQIIKAFLSIFLKKKVLKQIGWVLVYL